MAVASGTLLLAGVTVLLTSPGEEQQAIVGTAATDGVGSETDSSRSLQRPPSAPAAAVTLPVPSTTRPPDTVPPTAPTAPTAPVTTAPPTTAPPTAPPTTEAPVTTVAPAPPVSMSPRERFERIIPSAWRARLSVRIEVIPGSVSWGHTDRIQIAQAILGDPELVDVTLAHEFGHVIAFAFGTGAYHGAAPAGWPPATANPAEHWADCVQQVFIGVVRPSHGLPPCGGAQLDWARRYLTTVPA